MEWEKKNSAEIVKFIVICGSQKVLSQTPITTKPQSSCAITQGSALNQEPSPKPKYYLNRIHTYVKDNN